MERVAAIATGTVRRERPGMLRVRLGRLGDNARVAGAGVRSRSTTPARGATTRAHTGPLPQSSVYEASMVNPARATGFPYRSATCTFGCRPNVIVACAVGDGCWSMTSRLATPGRSVSSKLAGAMVVVVRLAVTRTVPATAPPISDTLAVPSVPVAA